MAQNVCRNHYDNAIEPKRLQLKQSITLDVSMLAVTRPSMRHRSLISIPVQGLCVGGVCVAFIQMAPQIRTAL